MKITLTTLDETIRAYNAANLKAAQAKNEADAIKADLFKAMTAKGYLRREIADANIAAIIETRKTRRLNAERLMAFLEAHGLAIPTDCYDEGTSEFVKVVSAKTLKGDVKRDAKNAA